MSVGTANLLGECTLNVGVRGTKKAQISPRDKAYESEPGQI